jgi:predicted Fe-Mo cluster-binding NifX family protein
MIPRWTNAKERAMKIAVSATGPSLDAEVDPRFGRCQHFIIVDLETLEFEAVDNTSAMASGGAGISAAQAIVGKGVEAVLTGNCGPNAYQVLSASGVKLITGVSGKVKNAVQQYKLGTFATAQQPNVPGHFGTGATPSMGSGFGMGRGMGIGHGMRRGIGRGIGMGGGMGAGPSMTPSYGAGPAEEQELQVLKARADTLGQQLADIQQRIAELEKKR